MMRLNAAGWLALALVSSGLVAPRAQAGDWSVGATASTLGLGAEVGYAINERFSLRAAGYTFSYGKDGEEGGINYDGDFNLGSVGAYLDWRPFAGSFRVSGGWFATDNHFDGVGTPDANGSYDIGGVTFTTAQVGTLSGTADLGSSAPYLGVGWLWGGAAGFGFSLDLGVLFQGSPDVDLDSTGGTLSGDPSLQAAIAQEEAELENDVDQYEYYPAVSFGVTYRF